jgi:GT2 family glycosyltransferase
MLQTYQKNLKKASLSLVLVENKENVGYPKGNNQGIALAKGNFVLLLNSDAMIKQVDFDELLRYMGENPQVGILTVKLDLPSGGIDPASHRGFPTIWNAFCYYSKLEKLLGKTPLLGRIFGGYHLLYKNLHSVHEIDSPAGAFFLTRKKILEEVDGFDETFFMYGEDLDLSYRIKEKGYTVIYYPMYSALHMKHHSGIKHTDASVRKNTRKHFYEAMKIFYNKHYKHKYPAFLTKLVFSAIDFKATL